VVKKSFASLLAAPALSGLFMLSFPALAAQSGAVQLQDTVIVSATRSATAAEDSPRTITVIGPEQIAEYASAGGIQRLLEEVPGIEYARTGGLGGQLVIRGQNTNSGRAILAIDGDRYRGRSTLEYNMIDPNSLERIEIIRGPASALYGSDAMNGVVNIVTRRAKVDPAQDFSLTPKLRAAEWSSDSNMYGVRGELVGGGNGFDVLVGVNKRTANDYDTPVGRADNSDYDMKGADFNVGFRPNEQSRWDLSGRYQNVTTGRAGGLGAAPGAALVQVREEPIVERYLRLSYQGLDFGDWADSLDASVYVRDLEADIYQVNRKNAAVDAHAHIKVYTPTVFGGHLTAAKQLGDHHLSYGGDWFHERFDGRENNIRRYNKAGSLLSDSGWNPMERDTQQTNFGLFINDDWFINEKWSITGALRGDLVKVEVGDALSGESPAVTSAFEGNTDNLHKAVTGSVGAVYRLTPDWHLVGNLSRGFRAPSGMELALTSVAGTITTIPAPDLDPETNITAEAGVRWYGERSQINLTAYQSQYDDLIATVPVTAGVMQRQNISEATISGVELAGTTELDGPWSLRYSAAATRGTDEARDQPLPGIAPLSGQVTLRYQASDWHAEGKVRGYKGRTRIDKAQERETASYAIADLYAGTDLSRLFGSDWKDWKLTAGVENVFDRLGRNPTLAEDIAYADDLVGNPLAEPGRTAMVKLRVDY
jgi:hemoglobin/transferrin/lactoferrin receptor protein